MARIRIRCRPPQPAGKFCFIMPSLADVEVFVVRDDGSEEPLNDCLSVTWASGTGEEPCTASLLLAGPELDVEVVVPDGDPPALDGVVDC